MNRFETTQMLAYVSEIDGRHVTEEGVSVWLDLLAGFEFEEVRAAVIRHSTESPDFLKPAHVVKLVKTARKERLNQIPDVYVNVLDDGRGPDQPKAVFDEFKRVHGEVKTSLASGRMGREQYNDYLHGRLPWDEFKSQLGSRALE